MQRRIVACNYLLSALACVCYIWRNFETVHILKPGGKVLLAFEDRKQLEKRLLSADVFHLYSVDEVKSLLQKNGFSGSIDIFSS